ncbi:MAG TPA: pilus assembly protein TadG-related protein [Anaerolineaceae bacterium]|nr:pilus assembly protein TadG-related protein [Anaerolineaceae bacterium]
MNKLQNKYPIEKGQVLPLVVIMFFVIIGMVALVLDGGAIMSNRRTAQAAADAGALAGAKRACLGKTDAKVVAENYATINHATSATATVSGKQVTVVTTVEHASFFAKIFGQQTLKANAEATAGCYGVRGKSVIPLAWNCRTSTVGGGPFDPNYGCKIQTLSWNLIGPMVDPTWKPASERTTSIPITDFAGNTKDYYKSGTSIVDSTGLPPKQLYIVIDSDKICYEDNPISDAIRCDLDGDGKKDIQTGGDRGWLYLTADTSNIASWIRDNGAHPNFTLSSHKWLSGKSGNDVDIYIKMIDKAFAGQVVMIPVYNVLCNSDPQSTPSCVEAAHDPLLWPAFSGTDNFSDMRNQVPYYHIIAFEPFYVSCVSKKGYNECPGFKYAMDLINDKKLLDDGPVIEGFFLSDYDTYVDIQNFCDINLGNCTVTLSK